MMEPQYPLPVRQRRMTKQQTPQEAIDEFWAKFTTKAPGKGEFVFTLRAVMDLISSGLMIAKLFWHCC